MTIAGNGTIYIGTMEGNLYAINPNGTEQWHLYLGGNLISTPAIGIHNTIYIGTTSHCLFAVNPNGTIQWQFQAGEFKGSPSIAADGTIYAPSFDGCLYALNPDGTMRWRASTGDSVAGAGVAVTADGTIYVGTEQLRAFYPNGTLKWCTDVQGSVYGTVPAVSADGTIYVTAGSNLVAVNPDGTVKWSSSISNEQSHSSPCIGQNDRVYVGSRYRDYGYLHAFGPGVPKKIEILQPQSGHLYFFGLNFGHLFLNHTIIIGAITIKVNVYSPDDIINVSFYIDSFHASVTSPPFEWRMDQQYTAKPQLKHTITVIGYYKGGPYWIESIPVIYVHL